MVRFIMKVNIGEKLTRGWIYIPLWLDLLYPLKKKIITLMDNLHSTMVRFIMKTTKIK